MADDVIKSFLVQLGFKSDETGLKNFTGSIEKAGKVVLGLATAIEATAVTVAAGVARFASNLESLYFASMRTGAAVSNLKAMDLAAQNFGASAGSASAAIESLARFMRNSPGGEGMISGWLMGVGESTRDAKGHLRDTADILQSLGKLFEMQGAHDQTYLSAQLASMFGIDDRTMLAIRNGDFSKELARIRKELGGSDWDKASERAHVFSEKMRVLKVRLETLGMKIVDTLQKKLGISLDGITDWLDQNGDRLAEQITKAFEHLFKTAEMLKPALEWLWRKFEDLDTATDGWSTKAFVLLGTLKAIGATPIITGILGLASAFVRLAAGITAAGAAATAVTAVGAGAGLGWLINHFFPNGPLAKLGHTIGGALFDHANRFNDAVFRLTNMGWSPEQAAGIVANLNAESGMNPNAVGDNGTSFGLAQWHDPARLAEFQKRYGHSLAGSSETEQYDFLNFELRHGAMRAAGALLAASQNAGTAGEMFARYFERPQDIEREARARGEAAVQIAQTTTIHVKGTDPHATAKAVKAQQQAVNADLTRNLQGALK